MKGADLKRIRKSAGMSQIEMATHFNVTQGYISRLESNKDYIGEELKNEIIKFAHEKKIKLPDDSGSMSNDPAGVYLDKKKDVVNWFDPDADKVIVINEELAHGKYRVGNVVTLRRHLGIIIFGRSYVIYFKGNPAPVICKVYPVPDDPESIRIKIADSEVAQDVPRKEIQEIYVVAYNLEKNF